MLDGLVMNMALDTPGHTLLNATKMVSVERRRRKHPELHAVGLENIENVLFWIMDR